MEDNIKIVSKYLIEKSAFIYGKKKQILSVCTDRVLLQNTSMDLDHCIQLNKLDHIHYQNFQEIK